MARSSHRSCAHVVARRIVAPGRWWEAWQGQRRALRAEERERRRVVTFRWCEDNYQRPDPLAVCAGPLVRCRHRSELRRELRESHGFTLRQASGRLP